MKNIKKIVLNDEPQENGNDVKDEGGLRLPPTGSGSGSEAVIVYSQAVISRGNFIWNAAVSADISISVLYELREGIVSFVRANVQCTNVIIIITGTNTGVTINGTGYSAISAHLPTMTASASSTVPDPITVNLTTVELKGFETVYDEEGRPIEQGTLHSFNVGISLEVSYGSSPTLGVFGVSADLIIS